MAEPSILLDASALLALVFDEPGAAVVAGALDRTTIGAVNLAEAVGVALRNGIPPALALAWAEELALPVFPFDATMAEAAAKLLAVTRKAGLSLGDCACLGAAQVLGRAVFTADRAWADLDIGVEVRLIR